jgi:hypothetical protein
LRRNSGNDAAQDRAFGRMYEFEKAERKFTVITGGAA